MLMNTTFLGDSFSIKWQSRVLPQKYKETTARMLKNFDAVLQSVVLILKKK